MPELPEVQTIVNDLNKKVIGRRITGVWFDWPKTIKKPRSKYLGSEIKNLKIVKIARRGKNIFIYLTNDQRLATNNYLLLVHQKMTGHLLYGKWQVKKVHGSKFVVNSLLKGSLQEKVNDYIHLIFYLDNGWQLALSDLRKFAKVLFGPKEEIENLPEIKNLGPEPLDSSFKVEKFIKLIKLKKGKIKQVLMDQEVIAGIGNIYSDEILWTAKIHPFRPANKLNANQLKNLYLATKKILKKALRLRGTSISDYRDTSGKSGKYAENRLVYQRENEPCFRCKTKIKRVKLGGRSAHFCPRCQKI
jgi:formamidopyrimidine-DNA glycosylase